MTSLSPGTGDPEHPEPKDRFPREFDEEFPVGPEAGNAAFFGSDVLSGLVNGVDAFIQGRQPRWRRTFRSLGPALLGSAMWIDDEDLIAKLGELSGASVIVSKQPRKQRDPAKLGRLAALNDRTPGMPTRAFSELTDLAPKTEGKPTLVGPNSPMWDGFVPTIRTLGFRKGHLQVPIIHAKLALLGHLWWHDEDGSDAVADVTGFEARRLWISSANFTSASRRSLEFGYWTEDPALVQGAKRFLVRLMRSSEGLDPDVDAFNPDLVPVEFDDAAMADAWADIWQADPEVGGESP